MNKDESKNIKIQLIFELGPVTTVILVQLMLVLLKITNYLPTWSWPTVFIPIWIVLLIICGTVILGFLYWVATTFILRRK